nr:unnamed protein product [Digitaria exilis]
MTVDAALLAAVVAFLLPLRLVSLALCLAFKGRSTSARHLRRSGAALAVSAALLAVIFALPRDRPGECAVPVTSVVDGEGLRSEVDQLKLQVARLESLLDNNSKVLVENGDTIEKVSDKNPLEEEDGHVMRAMRLDIQSLINEQETIKVRLIKDESRKMNSDIYSVMSLAKDATEKVEALHSDFKKVQLITGEWGKTNFNRMWSFAKNTERKVEDLYSDIKKGFKQTKRKVPFM